MTWKLGYAVDDSVSGFDVWIGTKQSLRKAIQGMGPGDQNG